MSLILETIDYKLFEVDSESELKNITRTILSTQAVSPRKFYKLEIGNTTIGILNEGYGMKPRIENISNGTYIISTDMNIYLFNAPLQKIIDRKLNSLVYEMYVYSEEIIVACELDFYSLDLLNLSINWHTSFSDVVTDFSINQYKVHIMTDDEAEYVVDLSNGNFC